MPFLRLTILVLASSAVPRFSQTAATMESYQTVKAKAGTEKNPTIRRQLEHQAGVIAFNLGQRYEHSGVAPDLNNAQKWYRNGSMLGSTDCDWALGKLYWNGSGVLKDRERAKYIWMMAAENRDPSEGPGERKSIRQLQRLGFDIQKERDAAFNTTTELVLHHPHKRGQQMEDASGNAAFFFGFMFLGVLAQPES